MVGALELDGRNLVGRADNAADSHSLLRTVSKLSVRRLLPLVSFLAASETSLGNLKAGNQASCISCSL
jgi:hypothetical protein